MTPGRLDQRVTLQRRARVADGQGGYTETWVDLRTVWAGVQPVGGRERGYADQLQHVALYRVTLRRLSDLTADDRIVWGSVNLDVQHIDDAGARARYMTVECRAGAAQ